MPVDTGRAWIGARRSGHENHNAKRLPNQRNDRSPSPQREVKPKSHQSSYVRRSDRGPGKARARSTCALSSEPSGRKGRGMRTTDRDKKVAAGGVLFDRSKSAGLHTLMQVIARVAASG